jgi:trans-aconitate 2-methyltransferase
MNTYSWNAQDYARNSQAQQKWARELMTNLNLKGVKES